DHAENRQKQRKNRCAQEEQVLSTNPCVDSKNDDHDQVKDHVQTGFRFRRMIFADIEKISKAGDRGRERANDSQQDGVESAAIEPVQWIPQADEIQNQAESEQTDWKMDQERVQRMAQRFAFESVLDHNYFSCLGGTFAP